jgi:L-alanine-DL-glutamate epimerase-like enolase superfamily enzyme
MMIEFGMLASPHAWGSFNKTIYTAHFAGGYGNTCTIEGVTCTSEHVDFGNYEIKNGLLIPPTGNGWGMKLKNPSQSYD